MQDQLILFICVFGAVGMIGYFASRLLFTKQDAKIGKRLAQTPQPTAESVQKKSADTGIRSALQRVGQAAAEPFMPKSREKQSGLRKSLQQAGIYTNSALKVMTGAKVLCMFGGLAGGYLAGLALSSLLLGLSVGGLVGYLLPTFWLRFKIKANQRALTYGLPDGLDLMVVCVEAGLTVDAAMQRVGQELALAHPALSREFGIAHMETRVGLSRTEALKNLGTRTNNTAIQSLASMLTQADRFGTSIAQALRIHAETLRINRQAAAEEMASKASVKMSFPLVLFIFPATFIVLAGPTIIGLMNSPLFQ